MNKIAFTLIFSFLLVVGINGQEKDTTEIEFKSFEQTEWEESDSDWDDIDWGDFQWDGFKNPFLEASYGISKPAHKNFSAPLSNQSMAELKLGYLNFDEIAGNIIETKENYFLVSNISTKFGRKEEDKIQTDIWRFGFGVRRSLGYNLGDVYFLPYTQGDAIWSRVKVESFADLTPEEIDVLNLYHESFRFGTSWTAGIKLDINKSFALDGGYEISSVFPRHLFGKHLGSFVIEQVGVGLLEQFIDEVMYSSPAAGPVVNFLLKNGFLFAFSQLKKEKMNWPFDSASPLIHENFKIGVQFTF